VHFSIYQVPKHLNFFFDLCYPLQITPGKIAEVTSPKPTSAPTTLAESPETPHNGDDTDMLKVQQL
jgi:hypothetical protein